MRIEDIILVGSGGCMREIVWQIQEQNKKKMLWNIVGYVDNEYPKNGIGINVGKQVIHYLGNDEFLLQKREKTKVGICVGNPMLRMRIANRLKNNSKIQFPNIILGNASVCEDVKLEEGCIISIDSKISTNVHVGSFVFMNISSMVCHDGRIDSFVTLGPDVKLAGNVSIGKGCDIGMGSKIIQGIHIGENVIAGAGSVIVDDIENNCTVVGVPARKIKEIDYGNNGNCRSRGKS